FIRLSTRDVSVIRISSPRNSPLNSALTPHSVPVRPPAIHLMEAGQALEIGSRANGKPRKSRFPYSTTGFKTRFLDIHDISSQEAAVIPGNRSFSDVGQVGNLRRVVNPPTQARLPIAGRLTTCPTAQFRSSSEPMERRPVFQL